MRPPASFVQKDFAWKRIPSGVQQIRSLKAAEKFPPPLQSNVREPGVNPGRLRHCNGYNSQCHCHPAGRREEVRCPSQDTGLIALVGKVDGSTALSLQPTQLLRK